MRSRLDGRLALLALLLALPPVMGAAQDKPAEAAKPAEAGKSAAETKQPEAPVKAALTEGEHVFDAMAGSWTGGGTLSLSSGTRERLRCRAHHTVGQGGRSLALSIRCASDSYRFDLSSNVVNRRGRIYGRWSEAANGVSGTVAGSASAGRIRAVARSDSFTAGLAITTQGGRQSVSITPRQTFISGVHIALRKR